jgi:hypothetical protein
VEHVDAVVGQQACKPTDPAQGGERMLGAYHLRLLRADDLYTALFERVDQRTLPTREEQRRHAGPIEDVDHAEQRLRRAGVGVCTSEIVEDAQRRREVGEGTLAGTTGAACEGNLVH